MAQKKNIQALNLSPCQDKNLGCILCIVLPLLLSRIIIYKNLQQRVASIKGLLTDWSFFVVMYTIIGMNRDLIFEESLMIAPSPAIISLTTSSILALIY